MLKGVCGETDAGLDGEPRAVGQALPAPRKKKFDAFFFLLFFFPHFHCHSTQMSVKPFVVNLQRTVNVNIPLLESNVHRIQRAMGVEKFRVNVWLRSDKMVQKMNKYDRNVDAPTDVLSYGNLVRER